MEPNKFEKHIKKQLREREIRPSKTTWDALSERLDDVAPQSKKRNYIWYGMAASFIGLLIASIVYFTPADAVNTPNTQIVNTDNETSETKIEEAIPDEITVDIVVVENENIKESSGLDKTTLKKNQIPESKNEITSIDEVDTVFKFPVEKMIEPNDFKEEIINSKIVEIVATIDSLEQNNDALTEAEVNELLRNAQEDILRDRLFNQTGNVDAMVLLSEVEDELDKSFRDQIFESLKTGFLKVRTAVADRNK